MIDVNVVVLKAVLVAILIILIIIVIIDLFAKLNIAVYFNILQFVIEIKQYC